jgi:SNF2 family DNA or RNA helicase
MAESSSSAFAQHVHLIARPGLPALISEPWHNSGMTGPDDASNEALGLHWPNRLFGYQKDGIERLLNSRSVLLADEMGLGKTIQAIAALRILAARGEIERALIVCPVGLIAQWRRQIRIWAPDLAVSTAVGSRDLRMAAWRAKATLTLSNFESVRADLGARSAGARRTWDVVVIDEAQRMKNPKSGVAFVIKSLERRRSWALTGTPLENRLDDLISLIDFAAPGEFEPGAMGRGLRGLVQKVQLRRRRAEVLDDLPPKFASVIGLDLTPAQRAAYQKAEEEGTMWLRSLGRELRISHVLELILRLKQICNFCPETGHSTKLVDLRRRLEEFNAASAKALVFSQFVEEPFGVLQLAKELQNFRPLVVIGGMDQPTRSATFDSFERDSSRRAMILSLRAGGTGLNLTAACRVVHFDRWWNPAVEAQAEDRVHRIGQTRPVEVFAYLCADTVEERIAAILDEKRRLFSDLVDGVPARALARLDLDDLLRAAAPAF